MGQVIELDLLLKGVKKDRERVLAFLDKMTDVVIKAAQHYQQLGADYISIRDMGTGTDLLSPRMWKDLIQPNLVKIFAALKPPRVNHICGSTNMIIEMMNECGADALSVDHKNDMAESRKKVGNDVLIFGDFEAYSTLVQMRYLARRQERKLGSVCGNDPQVRQAAFTCGGQDLTGHRFGME